MKHKHCDVLMAIAEGKPVEWQRINCNGCWHEMDSDYNPIDDYEMEWRVKPEPKPDVVVYHGVDDWKNSENAISGIMSKHLDCFSHWDNQVKITFDGETGKPKSVELLK